MLFYLLLKQISRLTWQLQPPGKINGKNVLQHIDRLYAIEALALPEGVERTVHQNRLLKLAREGRKMSSRDLADFSPARRYATMVCVLTEARATIIDEIIELHERILGSMFNRAKHQQAERLQKTGKLIQQKLRQYVSVGQAILDARNAGEDPLSAIERVLPWDDFVASLEETKLLARKDNFEPLHLITEKFSTLRKYSFRFLSALQLRATSAALPLNDALETIRDMYRKQLRKVPASAPLDFIPESWRKMVVTPSGIDRQYYEICAMNELKGALRAGDIWVRGSRRYKNFDDYLMPNDDFEKLLNNNLLNLPVGTECGAYLFTEHVFALMHLLGFAFAPRIRDLHDKRLFIQGKADNYPALQSIISTTPLNLKEIKIHWNEILRLATSIKQGTVTASLMLKKLASYPKQNGLAKALREIGRIERTLFMLDWFRDPALRRRVQAGLNKGEARNALARAVFMHRLGEIRDRGIENQSYRASGLTLLTAAITLWNTVYIENAINLLKKKGLHINEQLLSHLSPLGWEHINLTGDYIWKNNKKLAEGKYRPLRAVDVSQYKK